MDERTFKKWLKERDEIMKSYDLGKFKAFYKKWESKGLYKMDLPSDKVIEISMRKAVYHMTSATKEERREAERWLLERGYTTSLM